MRPTVEEFEQEFKFQNRVGFGGFADVYKVKKGDRSYALKLLMVNDKGCSKAKDTLMFFREARALKANRNRNVVAFYGLVKVPVGVKFLKNSFVRWGILQELCTGGAASKKVMECVTNTFGKSYTFKDALRWCSAIAEALTDMHNMDPPMIHRDVKTENILLQPSPIQSNVMEAKLSDFGLHQVLDGRKGPGIKVKRTFPSLLGSRDSSAIGLRACETASCSGYKAEGVSGRSSPAVSKRSDSSKAIGVSAQESSDGSLPRGEGSGPNAGSSGPSRSILGQLRAPPPGASSVPFVLAAASAKLAGTTITPALSTECPAARRGSDVLLDADVSTLWDQIAGGHENELDEFEMAFNLTGDTGSCFYMPPEVHKSKPYNQKADVFRQATSTKLPCTASASLVLSYILVVVAAVAVAVMVVALVWVGFFALIMYELFSFSLLSAVYAVGAEDSHAAALSYIKKISKGWRPPCVFRIPQPIWNLIEDCWNQDPGARPDMAYVAEILRNYVWSSAARFPDHLGCLSKSGAVQHAFLITLAASDCNVSLSKVQDCNASLSKVQDCNASLSKVQDCNVNLPKFLGFPRFLKHNTKDA
eukprot:gene2764-12637_t